MRRLLTVLTLALVAGACGDTTGPGDDEMAALLEEMAAYAYGSTRVGDPGNKFMERLAQLPPELALTAAQRAEIEALIAAHVAATATDRDALAAIMAAAKAAREAGKSRDEVQAILAGGAEIRTRLAQAERALHQAIIGVLTPAQRAALTGRTPREPGPCASVTEAQRNEISALRAAYEQTHAAEIAVIKSARERAIAARDAGATREQVAAILAEGREAMQRLAAARTTLREAIAAVLTPEQRAAGCFGR